MEESHGKKGGEMRGGANKNHHLDRVLSRCGIHILTLPSKPDLANSTFERGKEKRFADYEIQKKKKKKFSQPDSHGSNGSTGIQKWHTRASKLY